MTQKGGVYYCDYEFCKYADKIIESGTGYSFDYNIVAKRMKLHHTHRTCYEFVKEQYIGLLKNE